MSNRARAEWADLVRHALTQPDPADYLIRFTTVVDDRWDNIDISTYVHEEVLMQRYLVVHIAREAIPRSPNRSAGIAPVPTEERT